MIYLDSCAIVKLIHTEDESAALTAWLAGRSEVLVTSVLSEVEVPRAVRRTEPRTLGAVAVALARLGRVEIDASIRATAAAYVDTSLRSLDAIHVATAEMLLASGRQISDFVTYDKHMAAAARAAGLTTVAPS
ncbi:MAG TPA: type II toxin-antitoxin system VapC family toxin [Mycobacteriales bacterium]|nr:type II toxin-antitoxin system VapC family toxin [Mycobacteriales bacterium]